MTAAVTDRAAPRALRGEIVALARLAVPLALAQGATAAMAVTDAAFLGALGPRKLAACGLAVSVHATVQVVASASLAIVAPLLADACARGDRARTASLVRTSVVYALAVGAVLALALIGAWETLPRVGVPRALTHEAAPFLRVLALSTPLGLVATVFRHALTAAGHPRVVTATAAGAAVMNVALDGALGLGVGAAPALGAAGIAVGTLIAQAGAVVALAVVLARHVDLRAPGVEPVSWRAVHPLGRLGAPVATMVGAEVAIFQLSGIVVARFGEVPLAVHHLALTVLGATFVVPLGISQAAAVRVAAVRVASARNGRRCGVVALALVSGCQLAVALALATCASPLAVALVGEESEQAREVATRAVPVLHVVALALVFDGLQSVASGALRGRRDTVVPARLALLAYGVVAPLVAWGAWRTVGDGLASVWLGLACALGVAAATLTGRFVCQEVAP